MSTFKSQRVVLFLKILNHQFIICLCYFYAACELEKTKNSAFELKTTLKGLRF